ncbi:MAG TPA: UDP-glucose 4-epimerase GalE [Methylomirabilota bacterium]|jgi:UDP-glucose 4-epimerase|nr:UDP-glucose 4-epimerase GalE [Methylomirabilota bacterium]
MTNKKILVTGGAGYIGSHTVRQLMDEGYQVVVLDNLSTGHAWAVSCPLIIGDLADKSLLNKIFGDYDIEAVMHFAASISVEESVLLPSKYFENNVVNGLNLLNAMTAHGVQKIIFSSTAAVYGEPRYQPIDEDHPKMPINPYGETKLMFEKVLKWYHQAYNLSSISLRYFNASGASLNGSLGEDKEIVTHLIPRVLAVAAHQAEALQIYGRDYPTADGTCIRDYIHVSDLAQAHLLALKKLEKENCCTAYNVASGHGYSVNEVINMAMEVTRKMIPIEYGMRRAGDPANLVADAQKIKTELGFEPKFSDLRTIITTSWQWYQKLLGLPTPNLSAPKEETQKIA